MAHGSEGFCGMPVMKSLEGDGADCCATAGGTSRLAARRRAKRVKLMLVSGLSLLRQRLSIRQSVDRRLNPDHAKISHRGHLFAVRNIDQTVHQLVQPDLR